MNSRGRPEHQVRGETGAFARRAKTLDFPGRGLPAGGSGEATGDRGAGQRVMGSIRKFLQDRLKLKINEQKSAVDRPWKLKFLANE